MPIFDLFSKRQAELRGEVPDVFKYDSLPEAFRVQFIHLMRDAMGEDQFQGEFVQRGYEFIHSSLAREYGVFRLTNDYHHSAEERIAEFFLKESDVEKALDVVEFTMGTVERIIYPALREGRRDFKVKMGAGDAIKELNARFRQHGIGYAYENGSIIRIDSTYTHSEIVKPTIALLLNPKFSGANEEYMKAHEHYRHGRNKECLVECLKALESTIKIIAQAKGWKPDPKATSSKLVKLLLENNFVPEYHQTQLTSLRSLLDSGAATIRNREGGHGQGAELKKVDDHLTRYALNLTGSTIVFLVEQSEI